MPLSYAAIAMHHSSPVLFDTSICRVHTYWSSPRANTSISQLSRYPALQDFEQRSSVPKVYLVLGLGALYSAFVFFNIAGEFLVNVAGFVIPGYYSLEALFSSSTTDDTQWLTVCTA